MLGSAYRSVAAHGATRGSGHSPTPLFTQVKQSSQIVITRTARISLARQKGRGSFLE